MLRPLFPSSPLTPAQSSSGLGARGRGREDKTDRASRGPGTQRERESPGEGPSRCWHLLSTYYVPGTTLGLLADSTDDETGRGRQGSLTEGTAQGRPEPGSSPGRPAPALAPWPPGPPRTKRAHLWETSPSPPASPGRPCQPRQLPTGISSAWVPAPGWRQPMEEVVQRPLRLLRQLISHRSPTHDVSAAKISSFTAPTLVTEPSSSAQDLWGTHHVPGACKEPGRKI